MSYYYSSYSPYYRSYYGPYYSSYYSPYYRSYYYDAPSSTTTTYHGPGGSTTTTTYNDYYPYTSYSSYYSYPSYRRYYDRDYTVTYHYDSPSPVRDVVVEEEYITPSRKRTVTRDYAGGTTKVTYHSP